MTEAVDLCNRALLEAGARSTINSLTENNPGATACRVFYNPLRQQLLRTAPWGFCRRTIVLTLLGSAVNVPPDSIYPWAFKYLYPPETLKVRYLIAPPQPLPPPVNVPDVGSSFVPYWCPPSRNWRFVVSDEVVPTGNNTFTNRKVILSNVPFAYAVVNADIEQVDFFDSLFAEALVQALANKLVIPVSGNVQMKPSFMRQAQDAIDAARAADGNEAHPTTEHLPDWLAARAVGGGYGYAGYGGFGDETAGFWQSPWDNMNWGM